MNIAAALVLGLLIGWLIEWVVDWFYWRRPKQEEKPALEPPKRVRYSEPPEDADDFTAIKGVGPVIAKRLNEVGIYKYEQLAELTLDEFEEALDNLLERFINERSILRQARELANVKQGKLL